VTRVEEGHETAVALVKGARSRALLKDHLLRRVTTRVDFNEMLSPRTLQEKRLREFASQLSGGMPANARPAYTRPAEDVTYAYDADEFVAPNFEAFFADDAEAGAKLDQVYAGRENFTLSDRELLELFRRGVRSSAQTPNTMFSWISSALGWPRDPLLTEIFYQALDTKAPFKFRDAGIYYGFGLGTAKTKNILEAMYQVYMTPPFDRTTNGNMRYRILWGVGNHEDDKYFLSTRFAEALRGHTKLSDEALRQADLAYRQLADEDLPNFSEYGSRGVYVLMIDDRESRSVADSRERLRQRVGDSEHLIDTEIVESDGRISAVMAVRGIAGLQRMIDELQQPPKIPVAFADLLTRELIDQSKSEVLRKFEEHLPQEKSKE
jgi:hypothetical protein